MAGPLGPNGLSRTQPLGDDRATPQAARKGQESVKARTEIVGVHGLELAAICAPDHCDVANPIAAVDSKKIPDPAVIKALVELDRPVRVVKVQAYRATAPAREPCRAANVVVEVRDVKPDCTDRSVLPDA